MTSTTVCEEDIIETPIREEKNISETPLIQYYDSTYEQEPSYGWVTIFDRELKLLSECTTVVYNTTVYNTPTKILAIFMHNLTSYLYKDNTGIYLTHERDGEIIAKSTDTMFYYKYFAWLFKSTINDFVHMYVIDSDILLKKADQFTDTIDKLMKRINFILCTYNGIKICNIYFTFTRKDIEKTFAKYYWQIFGYRLRYLAADIDYPSAALKYFITEYIINILEKDECVKDLFRSHTFNSFIDYKSYGLYPKMTTRELIKILFIENKLLSMIQNKSPRFNYSRIDIMCIVCIHSLYYKVPISSSSRKNLNVVINCYLRSIENNGQENNGDTESDSDNSEDDASDYDT